jgi:hypothetical protein
MNDSRRRTTVRVPQEFRAIAESEKRSVSNMAFKVLSDYVEERNQRKPTPASNNKPKR